MRAMLIGGLATAAVMAMASCDAPSAPARTPSVSDVTSTSATGKGATGEGASGKGAKAKSEALKNVAESAPLEYDASGLVKAPGSVIVAQQCAICHSLKLVTQNRGDREHWKSLLTWMQKTQGLWQFPPAQEDEILTYLSTYYGESEASRRPNLPRHLLPTRPAVDATKVARAKKAIKTLGGTLQSALKGSLPAGAPAALKACHAIAPTATGGDEGVKVGRTSSRLRNPKNTAPKWVSPLLKSFENGTTASALTVARPNGGVGVVTPIRLQPVCVQCHGSAISDPVKSELSKLYPSDQATGYAPGELRGVFWAEVD